jgi:hypothetical protein
MRREMPSNALAMLLLSASMSPLQEIPECATIIRSAIADLLSGELRGTKLRISKLLRSCRNVRERLPRQSKYCPHVLDRILEGLQTSRNVRLTFRIQLDSTPQTKLSPYKIGTEDGALIVTGRSSVHRTIRSYDLSDILNVELLDESFAVPSQWIRSRRSRE